MVNTRVTQISASRGPHVSAFADPGELVLARPIPGEASVYDCMWYAWDEAQLEAEQAYAAWCLDGTTNAYVVYRAAQDRADAAQDALARCAGAAPLPGMLESRSPELRQGRQESRADDSRGHGPALVRRPVRGDDKYA